MNKITTLLDSEPIITRVGPIVTAVVVYLVAKGLIDQDTANLLVALAVGVVGSGAMVSARARVEVPPKPLSIAKTPPAGE